MYAVNIYLRQRRQITQTIQQHNTGHTLLRCQSLRREKRQCLHIVVAAIRRNRRGELRQPLIAPVIGQLQLAQGETERTVICQRLLQQQAVVFQLLARRLPGGDITHLRHHTGQCPDRRTQRFLTLAQLLRIIRMEQEKLTCSGRPEQGRE